MNPKNFNRDAFQSYINKKSKIQTADNKAVCCGDTLSSSGLKIPDRGPLKSPGLGLA